jgi:hypothetical protein
LHWRNDRRGGADVCNLVVLTGHSTPTPPCVGFGPLMPGPDDGPIEMPPVRNALQKPSGNATRNDLVGRCLKVREMGDAEGVRDRDIRRVAAPKFDQAIMAISSIAAKIWCLPNRLLEWVFPEPSRLQRMARYRDREDQQIAKGNARHCIACNLEEIHYGQRFGQDQRHRATAAIVRH